MKKLVSVRSTRCWSTPRLTPIEGSAGRYMSMAKGPIAVNRPSTRAFLKKPRVICAFKWRCWNGGAHLCSAAIGLSSDQTACPLRASRSHSNPLQSCEKTILYAGRRRTPSRMTCLLTTEQMYAADKAAAAGVPSLTLMENAGWQVARAIRQRFAPRPVSVLCGPGNNGGDGFVAARYLRDWGWPVRLALLGEVGALKGDAAAMAARWTGLVEPLEPAILARRPLVIDALFGAGLARPLDGVALKMVEALNAGGHDVVAVDVPSGVEGNTGAVLGAAPQARLTVTFFRPKPAHALMPGRALCGELVVAEIGIPVSVLDAIAPQTFVNSPELWRTALPWPKPDGHKYDRGHLLVAGGAVMTGAARLVAGAGRRAGAGLTTIAAPDESAAIYRG